MQLSTRGRYAVMAMVDLATRQTLGCECGPVCLAEIAAGQQLSLSYLEQLFGKLRRAGLVASARGPGGGYRLARPSDRDRHRRHRRRGRRADPRHALRRGERRLPRRRRRATAERCQTHDLWAELGRQIRLFLEGVTLADVVPAGCSAAPCRCRPRGRGRLAAE